MRNPHKLKIIIYTARLIDLNEYLAAFPGAKESGKLVKWNEMKYFKQHEKCME